MRKVAKCRVQSEIPASAIPAAGDPADNCRVYNRPARPRQHHKHSNSASASRLHISALQAIHEAITMQAALYLLLAAAVLAATQARPQQQQQGDGGWAVKTDQTRNGGTVVRAEANKQWDVSKDGKVKAEVHGHWERTYGGPNNGQRDRGVGGSIGGSWG